MQTFKDGMDFYFTEKSHSARFVDFLEGVVPTKASRSRGIFCFVSTPKAAGGVMLIQLVCCLVGGYNT